MCSVFKSCSFSCPLSIRALTTDSLLQRSVRCCKSKLRTTRMTNSTRSTRPLWAAISSVTSPTLRLCSRHSAKCFVENSFESSQPKPASMYFATFSWTESTAKHFPVPSSKSSLWCFASFCLPSSLKERAARSLECLRSVKAYLTNTEDLVYSFLIACSQTDQTTGTSAAFMANFDFRGILENVSLSNRSYC